MQARYRRQLLPKAYTIFVIGFGCCFFAYLRHYADFTGLLRVHASSFRHFPNTKIHSIKLEKTFKRFFEDEKVTVFKKEFAQRCSTSSKTGTLAAVLNGGNAGLGSVLNNALNVILIAWEPSVGRHFALIETPSLWSYTPLSVFFEQPADLPCPILVGSNSDAVYISGIYSHENFTLQMEADSNHVKFIGKKQETIRYFGEGWAQFRNVSKEISNRDGHGNVFLRKSALVRTLWNFKPEIYSLLKELWASVVDHNGRFFAVHIRRSDKLVAKEMNDIPISQYWKMIDVICHYLKKACPSHIFVMYDEYASYSHLKDCALQSKSSIKLLDFPALINMTGRYAPNFASMAPPAIFMQHDKEEWFKHTREILLSITLLAMSDQLICTFSSNVCRLAALIRGSLSAQNVHSIDLPKWHHM